MSRSHRTDTPMGKSAYRVTCFRSPARSDRDERFADWLADVGAAHVLLPVGKLLVMQRAHGPFELLQLVLQRAHGPFGLLQRQAG